MARDVRIATLATSGTTVQMAPTNGAGPASKEDSMSATAPRLAQGTSDQRRLGVALGLLTAAVALLVAVTVGQIVARSSVAPATSKTDAHRLVISGTNGGGVEYTGIPLPAPGNAHRLVISGTNGGGVEYTGIPLPAPAAIQTNSIPYPIPGVRQRDNSIPYPIPGVRKVTDNPSVSRAGHGKGGSNGTRFPE
jgi:hypothetical protein